MSIARAFELTGAVVLGFVVVNLLRFRALQRVGVRTEGRVVDAIEEADEEGEQLVVRFLDARGTAHQVVSRGGVWNWRRTIGQTMTVTYDPANPRRARIHTDVRLQTWAGLLLGLIFLAIGLAKG